MLKLYDKFIASIKRIKKRVALAPLPPVAPSVDLSFRFLFWAGDFKHALSLFYLGFGTNTF